ncbi:PREDICTED: uncharacterized protein LOC108568998 isoform X2 [Nicrophorus vespilloides]|uniref:Uncharacterized protein LOC108568998 isoform X2 n=1 Tax=Nicrophorus vespilloides TaxID=110193 RepID=A0ABM1NGA7_NICVS|nr:PREDICTED: uncharacterized protein LOC108568998 isoform X2 [Nicrophorus vespilloides]
MPLIREITKRKYSIRNCYFSSISTRNCCRFSCVATNFDASGFVEELCPKLSYVVRCVLVNKLGLFLERGDDFFKAVEEKYGLGAAVRLLPSCSETLIKKMISFYHVDFNDRELIRIYKKYPSLVKFYFESTKNRYESKLMLQRYLIKNDMPGFITLCTKYLQCKFGRKGFLKFLRINKEYIIENPTDFKKYVKSIYRHLTDAEFKRYFTNMFPKNYELFRMETILDNLKLLHIDQWSSLFCEIYKSLYSIEYVDEKCLAMMSAEAPLRFNMNSFWHFYHLEEFRKMRIQISLAKEANSRVKMLNKCIETCKNDNNTTALLGLLQFFWSRHKNDTFSVRAQFLFCLINNFDLIELSDEHWKYINNIVFEVNGDPFYYKSDILKRIIYKKMKNGENCDEELVTLLDELGVFGSWRLPTNHPVQERECLLKIPHLWRRTKHLNEFVAEPCFKFLKTICEFNKNHPNYRISYYKFPEMLKCLVDKFAESEKTSKIYTDLMNNILRFIPDEEEEKELRLQILEVIFRDDRYYFPEVLYLWILKYHPDKMLDKVERVLIRLWKFRILNYEISKMHYNGISDAFNGVATEILDDNKKIDLFPKILWCLSYNTKYLHMIEPFIPSAASEIDLCFEKSGVQRIILKTLRNTFKQSDNISIILHYSNEDNVQYCLEPMYRTFYHTPQNLIEAPLTVLASRSFSVRKHSIFLSTALLPIKRIVEILQGLQENDASARKRIFKCNYSCLIRNPTLEILQLFINNLQLLHGKDIDNLDMILRIDKIPKKIFVAYFSVICNFGDSIMEYKKYKIIGYLDKYINKVPDIVCYKIIKDYLFNPDNIYISDTNRFVYNYITSSKSTAVTFFIDKIVNTHSKSLKFGRVIFTCFKEICNMLLKDNDKPKALDVSQQLLNTIEAFAFDNFKIKVLLKFVIEYLGKGYNSLPVFIVEQQNALIEAYGVEIFVPYSKIVGISLNIILTSIDLNFNDMTYLLIFRLLKLSSSIHNKLLAVQLLPSVGSRNANHEEYHATIREELKKDPNPLIDTFLDIDSE